ncbi:methyl-CpG-binding domain-containing protein 2-like [Chenopodium quinoa]|uniref:Uncharacterized protein n=1 Tax=Chenopodium quinoa TaxID=63459 RepID=A0A803MEX1_CHEQI|nr:methyl-CpG-binding domain-containing protein 2-like [Chenopodium quinoa]
MQEENPSSNPVILSSDDEEEPIKNDYQIVLYDPTKANANNNLAMAVAEPEPDPIHWKPPLMQNSGGGGGGAQRVLPAVGSFTVQCAMCFKWRLIPTKEKYEEIREHILQQPFTCDLAKEWRGDICCDTPTDIEQDNSRLWAIDKPNISQPPPGWERELRIRGEGCSKFADVYYIAPTGKRLRSMVEVQRYLLEHPEYIMQGVTLSQFSFQIPKPLQENYVRKRAARSPMPDGSNFGMARPLQTIAASPLSWAAPDDASALQISRPGPYGFSANTGTPPARKKARPSANHTHSSIPLQHNPHKFKIKGPRLPPNGVYDL